MRDERAEAYQLLWQEYQKDWVFFVMHALGHATWSKQREIIQSVQHNQKTAVRAAHNLSKTFSAAEIATAFYNLLSDSRIVTTAPTFDPGVKKILWPEINDCYVNSNISLIGKCLTTEIQDPNNPKHLAYGFSTNEPARAEGAHQTNLLFIFDEAKGIESWMWDAAKGALSGGFWRWLVISTTDGVETGSQYANCFESESDWNQIQISAFDSPNVTGEKFQRFNFPEPGNICNFKKEYVDPESANIPIANQQYIDDGKDPLKGWGVDSVMYKTKVLGEICDMGTDAIIRLSQTRKMFQNHDDPEFDTSGKKRGGVDVAWGGSAATVGWKAEGLKITALPCVISTPDLPDEKIIQFQADRLEKYYDFDKGENGYELKIDITGGGIGLVSEMQDRGWNVIPVNNAWKSEKQWKGKFMYPKVKDEMWFEVAKIIQDISCPNVPRLEKELVQRKTLGLDSKGLQVVEQKKDYIKRGFDSPDYGDSFLLTFFEIKGKGFHIGASEEDFY